MKRIAVLSDIHSNYYLLKKVLTELSNENIDEYIVCGDAITDGADDNLVLDTLKELNATFIAGNREQSLLNDNAKWQNLNQWKSMVYSYNHLSPKNKEFVSHLPIYKIITIENKKICISHGSPYNVREIVRFNDYEKFYKLVKDFDCDIYLFGHTHKVFNIKYKNRFFINSGSISANNLKNTITYGVITIKDDDITYESRSIIYDFEELKNYCLASDYHKECPEWSNLSIYEHRDGVGYCVGFINYLHELSNNNEIKTSELWEQEFERFMKDIDLDIL